MNADIFKPFMDMDANAGNDYGTSYVHHMSGQGTFNHSIIKIICNLPREDSMERKTQSLRRMDVLPVLLLSLFLMVPYVPMNEGTMEDTDNSPLSLEGIYWPMVGRDAFNTQEGESPGRGLQDPTQKWSDPENSTSSGAVSCDMTANVQFSGVSPRTIRFVVDTNRTHVIIRDGDNGKIAWMVDSRKIEGRSTNVLWVSPALMDSDSDGRVEVLVGITDGNNHQLALFEPNITLTPLGYTYSPQAYYDERVWLTPYGSTGALRSSSPTLFDLTGDGVEDVIVGAGNRLYAYLGNNGSLLWYLDIGPLGETLSTPAVFPGTGALKRIVVNSLSPGKSELKTTVVNFQGDHLKNVSENLVPSPLIYTHPGPVPMPAVTDVTGDDEPEILVPYPAISGYGRVAVYSYSLEKIVEISDIPGTFEGSIALADVDSDGVDEVLLQARRYTTASRTSMACHEIFWTGAEFDTRTLWSREGINIGTSSLYATPLACDMDEDDVPDAVFISNSMIYGISSDGAYLWNLSVQGQISTGSGVIGELNTDGFLDLYINGRMFSQRLIDLKVKDPPAENIYLADPLPVEGTPVTVNCVVENTRRTDARDVVVRFIDIDGPGGTPVIIGHDRIDVVDTAEASVTWVPEGAGNHTISVMVDPDGNISETDETNNQGDNSFYVLAAFCDLAVEGIHFMRGDGLVVSEKRLVENDPSWIVVTVSNVGKKPSKVGRLKVNVDGGPPSGGEEYTDIPALDVMERRNITVPWTPPSVPEGESEATFTVEALAFPANGEEELSSDNNYLVNSTTVKNATPAGSLYVQGVVFGSSGSPEGGVRITLTVERTGESLGPQTTTSDGLYGFDMNFIDYLDGDIVTVRGSKDLMWGENSSKVYSEDVNGYIDINLSDVPTLSVFLDPEGPLEGSVIPSREVRSSFTVENDGNLDGTVVLETGLTGNSSLLSTDIVLSDSSFTLASGNSREVELLFTVPDGEPPDTEIIIDVYCRMEDGNSSVSRHLTYRFTVERHEDAVYQMISAANVTLGPSSSGTVSFEFYILNSGNVPLSYQMSLSSSLEEHTEFRSGAGELEPGEAASPYADVTFPNGSVELSGTIYLSTSGLGTLSSWNIRIRRAYPNLEVISVIGTNPSHPVMGEEVELISSLRNSGDIAVSDIICSFFEDQTLIGSRTIKRALEPGEEVSVTGVMWTPRGIGRHTVRFVVDPLSEVSESSEDDNSMERVFEFYPDLSVGSVQIAESTPLEGTLSSLKVTVENEGNAPLSRGFSVTVTLDSKDGEQLASSGFDHDLNPLRDSSATVTLDFRVPDGGGNRTLYVSVKPLGEDEEKEVSDNTASLEISIRSRDTGRSFGDYVPYIIVLLLFLVVVGAGLYIWKFGLPSAPPPGEEGMPEVETQPEVTVEPDIPMEEEAAPEEEELPAESPVIEMELVPEEEAPISPEEEVLVAEVVEEEFEEGEPSIDEAAVPEV
ncbi:MAG: hypothetical protein DRN57_07440 [Thermoplasmata archaeon]|nr:MAG: hypothetical protein DRN57_07440 [Thermoplasmata archaeon]